MPVPSSQGLVSRSLLRDDAYRAIRDRIVDGTLAPGERLNEADLVSWLGVSRTPIREALARLERSGLIVTKPGRFTMVSELDARETREAQLVAAAMHELAVREAVMVMSGVEIEAMKDANNRFAKAIRRSDVEAALTADDDFHNVAVAACHNAAIQAVLEQYTPLLRRVERVRFGSVKGRASVELHNEIIRQCAAGDAVAAGAAARQNWLTLEPMFAADEESDTSRQARTTSG